MSTAACAIENLLSRSRSGSPSPQKDLRRAKRHRVDVPARFRIYLPSQPEHSSTEIAAHVIDLSRMGIGLLADSVENGGLHIMHAWPATSEQCLLEIQVLCDRTPLTLQGKAAWYSQNEDKKPFRFRIGIELLDLSVELGERIRGLIDLKAGRKSIARPEPD